MLNLIKLGFVFIESRSFMRHLVLLVEFVFFNLGTKKFWTHGLYQHMKLAHYLTHSVQCTSLHFTSCPHFTLQLFSDDRVDQFANKNSEFTLKYQPRAKTFTNLSALYKLTEQKTKNSISYLLLNKSRYFSSSRQC